MLSGDHNQYVSLETQLDLSFTLSYRACVKLTSHIHIYPQNTAVYVGVRKYFPQILSQNTTTLLVWQNKRQSLLTLLVLGGSIWPSFFSKCSHAQMEGWKGRRKALVFIKFAKECSEKGFEVTVRIFWNSKFVFPTLKKKFQYNFVVLLHISIGIYSK